MTMNNKRANAISGRRKATRNALKEGEQNKNDRPERHARKSAKAQTGPREVTHTRSSLPSAMASDRRGPDF